MNAEKITEQSSKNVEDNLFDEIIGYIEDILLGMPLELVSEEIPLLERTAFLEDEFHAIQKRFLEDYWDVFEPVEENKLIYTDIFNEYVSGFIQLLHFSCV